jgi:hypothetical protein
MNTCPSWPVMRPVGFVTHGGEGRCSQEGKTKESVYDESGTYLDVSIAAELVLYSNQGRPYLGDQRDAIPSHGLVVRDRPGE